MNLRLALMTFLGETETLESHIVIDPEMYAISPDHLADLASEFYGKELAPDKDTHLITFEFEHKELDTGNLATSFRDTLESCFKRPNIPND